MRTQYINYCSLSIIPESDLITDINDMSLKSENLSSNVNEKI